jgi:1,4-dihydroxy-2-naphthoate octaprenyltransferase
MNGLKNWLEISRPFSWSASIVPVFLGGITAYLNGNFSGALFISILFCVLLLHCASNILNEFFDCTNGIDQPDVLATSQVLIEGRISPKLALHVGQSVMVLFFLMSIAFAVVYQRYWVIVFSAVGISGAYYYTAPPCELKYRGLGLFVVFLLFGPVLSQAVYYALTGEFSSMLLWTSLPIAFLVTAILHGNDLRDIETDIKIITIAKLMGLGKGVCLYSAFLCATYIAVFWLILMKLVPIITGLVFLTIPVALMNIRRCKSQIFYDIDIQTAKLHAVFGSIWIFCLVI